MFIFADPNLQAQDVQFGKFDFAASKCPSSSIFGAVFD
jgi:hypothetical protein